MSFFHKRNNHMVAGPVAPTQRPAWGIARELRDVAPRLHENAPRLARLLFEAADALDGQTARIKELERR